MNFETIQYAKDSNGIPQYQIRANCYNCDNHIMLDNSTVNESKYRYDTVKHKFLFDTIYSRTALSTWCIALCFLFSFLIIPLIIGIILLIMQSVENSKLIQKYGHFDELDDNIKIKNLILDTIINDKKYEIDREVKRIDLEVTALKAKKNEEIELLNKELDKIKSTILSEETMQIINSLDYTSYDSYSSEECKNELTMLRLKEKELIRKNSAVEISDEISRKQANSNTKQILRCFNAECDNIILSVTLKNIDSLRTKIVNSFDSLNKLFQIDGVTLSSEILKFKLEELTLIHKYEQKYAEEKEIQKAIKAQMLEEEKVRRELEKRKKEIEKDQKQFNNEISKLLKYLQKSENDIEKQLYADKIKELEKKIAILETEKADVINREQNAKAGFVYIISNIGSFGENIYKIGMTRRLEPMDRIKELSSASVPFEFDVHAMIFSDDAPALEAALHQHFDDYKVNKINPRKEFFKISIDEIAEFIDKNYDKTVELTKIPVASEYRASLEIISDSKCQ